MINKITNYSQTNIYKQSFKAVELTASNPNNREQNSAVAVPMSSLMAYMVNYKMAPSVDVKFYNSIIPSQMNEKYGVLAKSVVADLSKRAGQKGQVLNWINVLPKTQLTRLDEIYALANSMKKDGGKLGIIGIGGSKHTIENLLSLTGNEDKVVFLSAVDPEGISSFVNKLGDLNKAAVMVASKSGTTLEPSVGFESVRKILGDGFTNYVCITDKDDSKSKLRQLANEKGYKCGIIHDDCGGRYGAFDDHTLTALAYCGMPKEDMKKMLEASLSAQRKFLTSDVNTNAALQRAIFNADCVQKGKQNLYECYFSNRFGGTLLWNTQMKKESHKSLYSVVGDLVAPEFLHNSTEADLDEGNKTSFYTFNIVNNPATEPYKAYNALVNGSLKAYSNAHPCSVIQLKDFKPETIAEFVELKHFEAMYTGMILRALKDENSHNVEVLPEVTQPNVKIYKKEVEKILKA